MAVKATKISAEELLADAAPAEIKAVDLQQITDAAVEMAHIDIRLVKWEQEANKLKERRRELEQQIIPDLMTQVGMKEITLAGDVKLIVDDYVTGNIPSITSIESCDDPIERTSLEQRRVAAFKWLRANKAADLIRNTIKADFGAGYAKDAARIVKELQAQGFKASRDENVHPATLTKFLREKIQQGQEVPSDTFNIFNGRKATLKAPKVKK